MITATMVSKNSDSAEFDVTMDGETRRVFAWGGRDGSSNFTVFNSPVVGMYATGTKRHRLSLEINGDANGAYRVTPCLQGSRRSSSRLRVVGWYEEADTRNTRNNLA
jgi:hypothetical protein